MWCLADWPFTSFTWLAWLATYEGGQYDRPWCSIFGDCLRVWDWKLTHLTHLSELFNISWYLPLAETWNIPTRSCYRESAPMSLLMHRRWLRWWKKETKHWRRPGRSCHALLGWTPMVKLIRFKEVFVGTNFPFSAFWSGPWLSRHPTPSWAFRVSSVLFSWENQSTNCLEAQWVESEPPHSVERERHIRVSDSHVINI